MPANPVEETPFSRWLAFESPNHPALVTLDRFSAANIGKEAHVVAVVVRTSDVLVVLLLRGISQHLYRKFRVDLSKELSV